MLLPCRRRRSTPSTVSPALKTQRWLGKIKGRDTAIHPCGRLGAPSRAALAATHEHCEAAALVSYVKKGFPAARKETLGTVPCAAAREQQPEQSPGQSSGKGRCSERPGMREAAGLRGHSRPGPCPGAARPRSSLYPVLGTPGQSWPWSGARGKDRSGSRTCGERPQVRCPSCSLQQEEGPGWAKGWPRVGVRG